MAWRSMVLVAVLVAFAGTAACSDTSQKASHSNVESDVPSSFLIAGIASPSTIAILNSAGVRIRTIDMRGLTDSSLGQLVASPDGKLILARIATASGTTGEIVTDRSGQILRRLDVPFESCVDWMNDTTILIARLDPVATQN